MTDQVEANREKKEEPPEVTEAPASSRVDLCFSFVAQPINANTTDANATDAFVGPPDRRWNFPEDTVDRALS